MLQTEYDTNLGLYNAYQENTPCPDGQKTEIQYKPFTIFEKFTLIFGGGAMFSIVAYGVLSGLGIIE